MNNDAKTAIARMIAQKNAGKESKPAVKKKDVIKKPSIDKPTADDQSLQIQNLMELIDIKKIVHDLVQKELQRLGIINSSMQKDV